MNAVAYVRASTFGQSRDGQRTENRSWAKDHGIAITAWFEDVGHLNETVDGNRDSESAPE